MKREKKIQVETLSIIILVTLIVTIGIIIFNSLTNKRKIENFSKEATLIMGAAKNAYIAFSKEGYDFLATSNDGTTRAMCITLEGLEKNGLIDQDLSDWDGYVIIEVSEKTSYKIWLTNKKYSVTELDESEINNLKLDKNLKMYDNEKFSADVEVSFEANKKYQSACINKKLGASNNTVEVVEEETQENGEGTD